MSQSVCECEYECLCCVRSKVCADHWSLSMQLFSADTFALCNPRTGRGMGRAVAQE